MQQPKLNLEADHISISPFLRWAGGKRWLTHGYKHLFPIHYDRYVEPFLGGGAVFFALNPPSATLSDINPELIATYTSIRDEHVEVQRILETHQQQHCKEYYYKIRSSTPESSAARAAKFIYLNRTCWNGLYRVNARGKFNVPIGSNTRVVLDIDDFGALSEKLSNVTLVSKDFEIVIDQAPEGSFIFADPPYTVKHNLNGFVSYNEKIFHWTDQERLCKSLKRAHDRGCMILLTNANHSSIIELYEDTFTTLALKRSSVIAGNIKNRGNYEELIVKNY